MPIILLCSNGYSGKRLENQRFLFGDYVTDSDVRLYVTLARLDIRYTWQLGHTKHRLIDYPNLWGYARDLYQIPAFRNNTYFKDSCKIQTTRRSAHYFLNLSMQDFWMRSILMHTRVHPHDRAHLSSDPGNKFKAEEQ